MPARRGVYVPSDLVDRMRKFPNHNWSRVAQSAWEQECDRLERRKSVSSKIEALRAEHAMTRDSTRDRGRSAAVQWISAEATSLGQIRRVVDLDSENVLSRSEDFVSAPALGWAAVLGESIWGRRNYDRQVLEQFGEEFLGTKYPSIELVREFISGVGDWFDEHKDEIEG